MKNILTTFCCFLAFVSAAQEHVIPAEKWSKNFYISDSFCQARGLGEGRGSKLSITWSEKEKNNRITRVSDIRWYFETAGEAEAYMKENYARLSEDGEPVTEQVDVPGVKGLKVYAEGDELQQMNKALGIETHMYIFLFTLKNYAAKVFVFSQQKITVAESAAFAQEAARRLGIAIQ